MKSRTFKEWSSLGFKVSKGSKAVGKDENGFSLFLESQVERPEWHSKPSAAPLRDIYRPSEDDFLNSQRKKLMEAVHVDSTNEEWENFERKQYTKDEPETLLTLEDCNRALFSLSQFI